MSSRENEYLPNEAVFDEDYKQKNSKRKTKTLCVNLRHFSLHLHLLFVRVIVLLAYLDRTADDKHSSFPTASAKSFSDLKQIFLPTHRVWCLAELINIHSIAGISLIGNNNTHFSEDGDQLNCASRILIQRIEQRWALLQKRRPNCADKSRRWRLVGGHSLRKWRDWLVPIELCVRV